jgi:hypothetical protein
MIRLNEESYFIDSENRTSGSDDSDITVTIHLSSSVKYNRVVLVKATIPKTYYLIDAPFNTFILEEDGVQVTITVPPGDYSRTSFQVVIEELLNTFSPHGWTYDVTYPNSRIEADTGKYTFAVSGSGLLSPSFIFGEGLHRQMGFLKDSTNVFDGLEITSTAVLKFQLEDAVFLRTNMVNTRSDNIMAAVFMNTSPQFTTVLYECKDLTACSKPLSTQNASSFRFWMTDAHGHTINFNGSNWNAEIMTFWLEPLTIPVSAPISQVAPENTTAQIQAPQPQNVPSATQAPLVNTSTDPTNGAYDEDEIDDIIPGIDAEIDPTIAPEDIVLKGEEDALPEAPIPEAPPLNPTPQPQIPPNPQIPAPQPALPKKFNYLDFLSPM